MPQGEGEAFRCTASGSSWLELTWPKEQAVVVAPALSVRGAAGERFSAARLKKRIMQQAMPSGLRSFLQH